MKKTLSLLALFGTAVPGASATGTAAAVAHAKPVTDLTATIAPHLPSPCTAADTLAQRTLTMLRRYDLTPFWNDPHGDFQPIPVLEGFFGKEHRRLGLAITSVRRDPTQPQIFWVIGKMRLRHTTTPFTGKLIVNKIADLQDDMVGPGESADSTNHLYTASASFHFRPLGAPQPVGEFIGQSFFDFVVTQHARVYMVTTIMTQANGTFPARGCGMVLRGHWVNATGKREPVIVAKDLFAIASEVLPDFGIGDRGMEVNPKYAHLGWNETWENEEWWADTPKPKLSL